jgi:hypothetical protein
MSPARSTEISMQRLSMLRPAILCGATETAIATCSSPVETSSEKAPTSPVMTPMVRSLMHQLIRAMASLWEACRCSMPGARSLPNGVRLNP